VVAICPVLGYCWTEGNNACTNVYEASCPTSATTTWAETCSVPSGYCFDGADYLPYHTESYCLNNGYAYVTELPNILSEDFESSTSWDDWYVAQSTYNYWIRSDYTTAAAGLYSAYITNDGETYGYDGDNGITTVTHLYRTVSFPVSTQDFVLSFDWKGVGENGYDYLKVYLTPSTTSPTSGSPLSTGQVGTANGYQGTSTWTQVTITLPAATYRGTTKNLVFSFRSDGYYTGTSPAAIDNILLTEGN
jgi:hypothetical protein